MKDRGRMVKTVCVIGAGAAGLCAAKTALENGMDVTVFELSGSVGGTWVYKSDTGNDSGYMYEGLRTDIPKEIMGFSDYKVSDRPNTYLTSFEVAEYLNQYAEHFKVTETIKHHHQVIRVTRTQEPDWEVIVKDMISNTFKTYRFDAVMVCNGHHNEPFVAKIKGQHLYRGTMLHSKDFRRASDYQGQKVLVIGSGASAFDIGVLLSKCAAEVVLSHHVGVYQTSKFPDNIHQRGDVLEFTENKVLFKNGHNESNFDSVIVCTGFVYSFPFLSFDCGIHVTENCVQPLYKHCININNPTMALIGLTTHCLQMPSFEIQSRFCLKYWSGQRQYPSQVAMIADAEENLKRKRAKRGWQKWHTHRLLGEQETYFEDLATTAEIPGVPKVYTDIFNDCVLNGILKDYLNYRNYSYKFIDDENFLKSERVSG